MTGEKSLLWPIAGTVTDERISDPNLNIPPAGICGRGYA